MSDRITKITTGKFDQVLAMTQYVINTGIENFWLAQQDSKEYKSLLSEYKANNGSLKNVSLKAPRIVVAVTSDDPGLVYFMIPFEAGKLTLQNSAKKDVEFDIAGWSWAFAVSLGLSKVDKTSQKYKDLQAAMPKGDYSIQALLLDMQTVSPQYHEKLSSFGTVDWEKQDKKVQKNFKSLIDDWLEELMGQGLGTVGYAAISSSSTQTDLQKPTFTPTALKFQTYPWRDPSDPKDIEGLQGNARLNYLLYQEMTKPRMELPTKKEERILPYVGNWTDGRLDQGANPSSVDFGTFAMSGNVFMKEYFLQKIRLLNRYLEPSVRNMNVELIIKTFTYTYKWNCDMNFGSNPDYDFSANHYNFKELSKTKYEFSSVYNSDQPSMADLWRHKSENAIEVWGQAGCECHNTVEFTPGTSTVKVTGSSKVHLYLSVKNGPFVTSSDDDVNFEVKWNITFDLRSVSDGGLEIGMTISKPELSENSQFALGYLRPWATYAHESYDTAITRFSRLEQDLAQDFKGQNKLFLPAHGSLFFKDPVLSHEGALLCSVMYNGNADGKNPNTTTQRTNVNIKDYVMPSRPAGIEVTK